VRVLGYEMRELNTHQRGKLEGKTIFTLNWARPNAYMDEKIAFMRLITLQ